MYITYFDILTKQLNVKRFIQTLYLLATRITDCN